VDLRSGLQACTNSSAWASGSIASSIMPGDGLAWVRDGWLRDGLWAAIQRLSRCSICWNRDRAKRSRSASGRHSA
jgi:hypothetical protein